MHSTNEGREICVSKHDTWVERWYIWKRLIERTLAVSKQVVYPSSLTEALNKKRKKKSILENGEWKNVGIHTYSFRENC